MDFKGSWEDQLHLVEFSYNNSNQASIQMSPFEALHGRKCRSVCWDDIGEQKLLRLELITQSVDKLTQIRKYLQAA